MKTFFTIHAGEYLVGSYIEEHFRNLSIWIPSKDTGIDLLLTNKQQTRSVSLQVKYSKDFNLNHETLLINKLRATGWWSIDREKLIKSKADFWVFVLPSFLEHEASYVVVPQKELLSRFTKIFGSGSRIDSYLWVTKDDYCWESRGLKKDEKEALAYGRFKDSKREFTQYLNNWNSLVQRLK